MNSRDASNKQRGSARHQVGTAGELMSPGRDTCVHRVTVLDISLGGCRLESPVPLVVGQCWRLRIGGGTSLERTLDVVVRWAKLVEGGASCSGVQFLADRSVLAAAGLCIDFSELVQSELGAEREGTWEVTFSVVADENLPVRAISGATIKARRDLRVTQQLRECVVEVGHRLFAPMATVAGGELYLQSGAGEVGVLGEAGASTTVVLGRSLRAAILLRAAPEAIAAHRAEIERDAQLAEALAARDPSTLSAADRELLTVTRFELDGKREMLLRIQQNATRLLARDAPASSIRLAVAGGIESGTIVRCGEQFVRFHRSMPGPLLITCDANGQLLCASGAGPSRPLLDVLADQTPVALPA